MKILQFICLNLFILPSKSSFAGQTVPPSSESPNPTETTQKSPSSWAPLIHIQTSPIGDLARRYNLQISHFFNENFALGLKGTTYHNGGQSIFAKETGSEIGVRGSYYWTSNGSDINLGGHFGLYYANFENDDWLKNVGSSTYEIKKVNGIMFEFMVGPLAHWDRLSFELLGGLQGYQSSYYNYGYSYSSSTPSNWKTYPVIEGNLGLVF